MKVFGVVYLILNKLNGKMYVGQTTQPLKKRIAQHLKDNLYIDKAIRKYGWENFRCEVLVRCNSKKELDAWEIFFITAIRCKKPNGYNRTDGGGGGLGFKHTPETRAKMSASRMGEKNPHYGKHHSAEMKAKLSAARKGENSPLYGIPLSDEHRAKIGAAHRGRPKSPEHCAKLSAAKMGKQLTAETCAKMSAAQSGERSHNYGKQLPAKTCTKISAANRGNSSFKNLLREIDARQLSYYKLAALMRVAYTTISAKMLGRLNFTERDKVKLEKILGKPAEYLLEREEN